ncbi:MAG: hypothetical protein Kow0098_02100 [Ignavibacteriaceae bacterium]
MIFTKTDIETITEDKLKSLKDNQVAEDKHLEYKLTLPGEKYDDKKEFLADLTSFANADGGTIFYGIKAKDGIPQDIQGLDIYNTDKEILRLENLLRTSVEPRIIGTHFYTLKLSNEKYLIAAYIPKSFNPPHVVNFQGHWKFYSRNSAGKYPLDVTELKSIISLSATVQERIRNFRIERISRIKNKEFPFPIVEGPKFIYHIIPISSFASNFSIDLARFEHSKIRYDLFYNLPKVFNYDGILIHNYEKEYQADRYTQIFRNGVIEVLTARLHNSERKLIGRNSFEIELIENIPKYLFVLNLFDLTTPLVVFYTVLDIEGYKIHLYEDEHMRQWQNRPLSPNDLILTEVILNDESLENLPLTLKPLFDPIWNAAGHPQSPNYNTKGEWTVKG